MLILQNIIKSYGTRIIIKNFSYSFPKDEIVALTGVNGAGKTTLLKIICNEEKPDEGVLIFPKDKILGYLPQEANENPEPTILLECCAGNEFLFNMGKRLTELEEKLGIDYSEEILEEYEKLCDEYKKQNGYTFENEAQKMLIGLGFDPEKLKEDPKNLSGGWRMRLELARLLIKKPDFLVLDEPTNHLDLPAIEWLENYLKNLKKPVLFVSHDEALLNNLPDRILNLSQGFIKEYVGNYEEFLEKKAAFEKNKEMATKSIQKKVERLSKFVDRFKAKASLASQAQNKMKMINKLNEDIMALGPNIIEPEINIRIPILTESSKTVITFMGKIGYDKPLSKEFSISISRGQKIAIIGANGLGKSTFLKTIIGEVSVFEGECRMGNNVNIGYYAQDQTNSLDAEKSVIENIKLANQEAPEEKLMRILGSFLFKKDFIHKPAKVLSGGEKSRLSLACLLVKNINLLILDEPTNHLDIISSQILANAISAFEGTVVFVSHNRVFIDNASTHLLSFEKGNVTMIEKEFAA